MKEQGAVKGGSIVSQASLDRSLPQPACAPDSLVLSEQAFSNRTTQRLLHASVIQAKLRIGQPGDEYEQEADRVAEQVMRIPEPVVSRRAAGSGPRQAPSIQRMCPKCEDEEEVVQAKVRPGKVESPARTELQLPGLIGGGQPLPDSTRAFFEPRFGSDFGDIRVHTDADAALSASALSASAYTQGRHVVFAAGQYAPGTDWGRRLLAHELAHTIQQQDQPSPLSEISIQRQPAPTPTAQPPAAPQASTFDTSLINADFSPQFTGFVTANVDPIANIVSLTAPEIRATTHVSLNIPQGKAWVDLGVGQRIEVGPTQTLLSSTREAVYRQGGVQSGAQTGAKTDAVGEVRDAQIDPKTKQAMPNVVAPWYRVPSALSEGNTELTVEFFDRPTAEFPLKLGDGTITETRGKDSFITSLAAKPENQPISHLRMVAWEVNWDMQINVTSRTPQKGGEGLAWSTATIPPKLEGPIAGQSVETWAAFANAAEAAKASSELLLQFLVPALKHDPAAHAVIVMALLSKAPLITVSLSCVKTGNAIFDAPMAVGLQSSGLAINQSAGKFSDGDARSVSFPLLDLVHLATISASSEIVLTLVKEGVVYGIDATAIRSVVYPFSAWTDLLYLGGGQFQVSWAIT